MNNLHFEGSDKWKYAQRKSIVVDRVIEGYYKKVGRLGMYWVNRAGHMVCVFIIIPQLLSVKFLGTFW